VTDLSEKTTKTTYRENRAENLRNDRSLEDDLKKHFSVLYDLPQKFDDYAKIPLIPFER
jgi:hypothetical protein